MTETRVVAAPARTAEQSWRSLYLAGGVLAFVALSGMVLDIALTMLPGWGAASVPTDAHAWLAQFESDPLLGMRNLDFLNIVISLVALPMYVALCGAHRRTAPAEAILGLTFVSIGTALFVAANAGLPMLDLSRQYASAGASEQPAIVAAVQALLARGAHGSAGAFPGFVVSEVGTLVMALAMLRGGVFRKASAWIGIVGVTILATYTVGYTFVSGTNTLVMAVAIPGGLLMIAWYVMVGLKLVRLGRSGEST